MDSIIGLHNLNKLLSWQHARAMQTYCAFFFFIAASFLWHWVFIVFCVQIVGFMYLSSFFFLSFFEKKMSTLCCRLPLCVATFVSDSLQEQSGSRTHLSSWRGCEWVFWAAWMCNGSSKLHSAAGREPQIHTPNKASEEKAGAALLQLLKVHSSQLKEKSRYGFFFFFNLVTLFQLGSFLFLYHSCGIPQEQWLFTCRGCKCDRLISPAYIFTCQSTEKFDRLKTYQRKWSEIVLLEWLEMEVMLEQTIRDKGHVAGHHWT